MLKLEDFDEESEYYARLETRTKESFAIASRNYSNDGQK